MKGWQTMNDPRNVLVGAALAACLTAIVAAPTNALAECPQCFDPAGLEAELDEAAAGGAHDGVVGLQVSHQGGNSVQPYFRGQLDYTEDGTSELTNLPFYCIDLAHTISGNWYCALMVSSYDPAVATLDGIIHPENLDLANYVLNNYSIADTLTGGAVTGGDIQRTLWKLVYGTLTGAGAYASGPSSDANVNEMLAAAYASGEGFEPDCDGVVAVILYPVGCDADGIAGQVLIGQALVTDFPASCGDCPCDPTQPAVVGDFAMDCQTLFAGQNIDAGTVCTEVVGDDLVVTYTTTGCWELTEAHLWVGGNSGDYPQSKKGNPIPGQFPNNSGDITGATEYSFTIPLADLGIECPTLPDDQYYVAAHAAMRCDEDGDGTYQTETGWSDGDRFVSRGNWGTYDTVTFTCECPPCDEPPSEVGCETAFAYSADTGTCFLDIDADNDGVDDFNRWGWTIAITTAGEYDFPIYAGAGQCDLTKGTLVGNLHVSYDGMVLIATYEMAPGYQMDEVHFYAGNEILPSNNGEFTVAPGQYPNIAEDLVEDFAAAYTWSIDWESDGFNIVAHAVVCGEGLGD
jgi:hypothetical protein